MAIVIFRYKESGRAAVGLSIQHFKVHGDATSIPDDFDAAEPGAIGVSSVKWSITTSTGEVRGMVPAGRSLNVYRGKMRFSVGRLTVPDQDRVVFEIKNSQWPSKLREMREIFNSTLPELYVPDPRRNSYLSGVSTPDDALVDPSSSTGPILAPSRPDVHTRVISTPSSSDSIRDLRIPDDSAISPHIFFPVKDRLIYAANKTLHAINERGDIKELTNPHYIDHGETNDDNPMIIGGGLMASMAISRLFAASTGKKKLDARENVEVEKARLQATKAGILRLLYWFDARRHTDEPGYLVRWKQSEQEGRTGRDWLAEPSLDEYSGLFMGLSWLRALTYWGPTPSNQWQKIINFAMNRHFKDIERYLKKTRGWLVRPTKNDMTVRGPLLFFNTYPLNKIMSGYNNSKIFDIGDAEKEMIKNSIKSFELMDDPNSGIHRNYKSSVNFAKRLKQIDDGTKWGTVASALIAVGSLATGGIALALGAGLVALGVGIGHDKLAKTINSWKFWKTSGDTLGKPISVDAGGYNTPIFDRFSLAAMWSADHRIKEAFYARSDRRFGGDDNGWMTFGIAGRIWMGVDIGNPKAWVRRLILDSDAVVPQDGRPVKRMSTNALRPVEGFVLGWAIIALALDIDPEIEWENYIKERVAPHDDPAEIQ